MKEKDRYEVLPYKGKRRVGGGTPKDPYGVWDTWKNNWIINGHDLQKRTADNLCKKMNAHQREFDEINRKKFVFGRDRSTDFRKE